jgi:chemotaxis protein methyltransferase CheR
VSTGILPLRPQVFAILSALIEERCGLHYELAELDIIADKLSTRAVEAGFESLLDYYYYLRYDAAAAGELDALVDALVVNETYFFRELESLRRAVSDFIAPVVAAGGRPRVWSAACATGEEPFTLAMLLADRGILDKVEIVASDISTRALARAASGEYGSRSLRQIPPDGIADRWLVKSESRIRVRDELRGAIQWRRLNLVDTDFAAALGAFDVILCRNVLIYFRDETAIKVLRRLTAALRPGGALLVGVSESLLRFGTSLSCEERGRVFFYRKGL